MADQKTPQLGKLDKEELKKAFDISHFDLNAVLRGVQLTLVGGMFYLQMPIFVFPKYLTVFFLVSSSPSPTKPRDIHKLSLQASRYSCWRRHCHSLGYRYSRKTS